jgi:hypothetical protein
MKTFLIGNAILGLIAGFIWNAGITNGLLLFACLIAWTAVFTIFNIKVLKL